jgi:hypothetical protein
MLNAGLNAWTSKKPLNGNVFGGGAGRPAPPQKRLKNGTFRPGRIEIACIYRLLGKPMVCGKNMREKKRKN